MAFFHKYHMNFQDLENFRLDQAVRFHDELNPAIWQDDKLLPEVRKQLLEIAQDFIDHLGLDDLEVADITLSGSNAAYTYTPHSDLDLHLLVDMSKLDPDEVYRELFNSKKVLYNDNHDIKIHGYDVELYVQDTAEPVKSLGEYSIKNDRWIKFPRKTRSNLDERATREKFRKLVQLSQIAVATGDLDKLDSMIDTLKRYRQAGLDEHGEFGPENLAYKALRSQGIVQQLYDMRDKLHSKQLSLQENDYEYMPPGAPDEDVERILRKMAQQKSQVKKQPGGGRIVYKRPADITGGSITDAEMVNLGFKWDNLYNKWRGTQAQWDRLYKDRGIRENSYPLDKPTPTPQQIMRKHGISYEHLIDQLTRGVKVELEHTNDSQVAYQIALDHMSEDPDYYTKLAKVGLEEAFDKPYPIKWEKSEFGDYDALAQLDDGTYLSIMFNNQVKKNWMVEFYRNNSQEVTGEGDAQRVFATVLTAIGQFIKKKKPDNLFFSAVKEDDPTGSRTKLYNRLVQKYASRVGYNVKQEEHPGSMAYQLTRINTVKEGASGYIPSYAEKNDPRFKTALTVDIKPDSIQQNARKLGLGRIKRSGIPPTARTNGKS